MRFGKPESTISSFFIEGGMDFNRVSTFIYFNLTGMPDFLISTLSINWVRLFKVSSVPEARIEFVFGITTDWCCVMFDGIRETMSFAFKYFKSILLLLFIIKNENLLAAEKGCNSMLYIEESRLV